MRNYSTLMIQLAIENMRKLWLSIAHFIPNQVFLQLNQFPIFHRKVCIEKWKWIQRITHVIQNLFNFFNTRKHYSSGYHCYFIHCFAMKPSCSNIARHWLDKVISNLPSNSQTIRKKRHCQPNLQTYLKCSHRCWSLPCN